MKDTPFYKDLELLGLTRSDLSYLPKNPELKICLSVDVEEYFHAANLSEVCGIKTWNKLPSTVEKNTLDLLDIFDQTSSKGTFFVLGYVAKRLPKLVKEIFSRGHEIASHGLNHKIAYLQNHKQFLSDIARAKKILEDIIGNEVIGYRAPNFSITNKNLWAYNSLISAGYRYDSSLHPVSHSRYGNTHRGASPEILSNKLNQLTILPLTTCKTFFGNIPMAGGAYWRLYPSSILNFLLGTQVSPNKPFPICYIHPWEIDYIQPYFPQISLNKRIRHYYGIESFGDRIKNILTLYKSERIDKAYQLIG